MEKAVHDAYARGRLPVWMPEISGGRPLLPNPNAGALYPLRPVFAKIPFPLAMRIFPPLHWVLAGLGVFWLLLSLGATAPAAWVGAMTYAFSGVAVSEVFFPHILPGLALLPWVVWAAGRAFGSIWRKLLLLSCLFALELLSADVFSTGLAFGSAVLWILLEGERASRGKQLALLGGSLGLALLAAAPQVVATALWIPESARAVTGMKLRDSLLFTISPLRLLELVIPYPFGSTFELDVSEVWARALFHRKAMGLFATLYCGAFALIAAVSLAQARLRGMRFTRSLALAAIAVACLPSLLPASWVQWASPLALRNPEKLVVGLAFALALFAGLAFDRFRSAPPPLPAMLAVAALLTLAAAAARLRPGEAGAVALAAAGEPSGIASLVGKKLAVALAEAGLFWTATLLAVEALRRLPRAGTAVSLALLTFVPIAANRRIARTFSEEAVFAPTPFARVLSRTDPQAAFRTLGVSGYHPRSALERTNASNDVGQLEYTRRNWNEYTAALWERGEVFNRDFDAGDLSRLESLRRLSFAVGRSRDTRSFFGGLSLKWAVRFRDQEPLPGYHRFGGDALMDWDEHERAYPDMRLLTSWREEPGALAALEAVPRLEPGQIAIEAGARRAGTARPGSLRVLEKSPERVALEIEAPDATWLFLLRGYWSYRTVLLDGRPVEDVPAQLAFSAVRIPAGQHRVEWIEEVPGLAVSRFGPVLFLIAAAGLLLSERRAPAA